MFHACTKEVNPTLIHYLYIDFSWQLCYQEGPEICEPAGNPTLFEVIIEEQAGYPEVSNTVQATSVQVTELLPTVLMPVNREEDMTNISCGNKEALYW